MPNCVWPVHATAGPSTDATSATLAALSAHAPITLVAATVAAHASESPALASFATHVPLAAITTTMPRQQPDRSGLLERRACQVRPANDSVRALQLRRAHTRTMSAHLRCLRLPRGPAFPPRPAARPPARTAAPGAAARGDR